MFATVHTTDADITFYEALECIQLKQVYNSMWNDC